MFEINRLYMLPFIHFYNNDFMKSFFGTLYLNMPKNTTFIHRHVYKAMLSCNYSNVSIDDNMLYESYDVIDVIDVMYV